MTPEGTNLFEQQEWPLEPCANDTHTDPQGRVWSCHRICGGEKGGRWAYHSILNTVLVDSIQNMRSAHFVGMLAVPWDGVSKLGWVLGRQWCSPAPVKLETAPVEATRFERLAKPPEED